MSLPKHKFKNSENVWHVSDTHFGHARILQWMNGNRPWSSVAEMDEALIERWNSVVGEDDWVVHYGDFSYHNQENTKALLSRLKGKIVLIFGNHDDVLRNMRHSRIVARYETVNLSFLESTPAGNVETLRIHANHFPLWDWDGQFRGAKHFHGHTHGRLEMPLPGSLDVSIDSLSDENNELFFRPVSTQEMLAALRRKEERLLNSSLFVERIARLNKKA